MLRLLSAMAAALQRPSRAYLCSLWAHSFSSPLLSAAIDRVTHQVIPWRFPGLHADLLHLDVPRAVTRGESAMGIYAGLSQQLSPAAGLCLWCLQASYVRSGPENTRMNEKPHLFA